MAVSERWTRLVERAKAKKAGKGPGDKLRRSLQGMAGGLIGAKRAAIEALGNADPVEKSRVLGLFSQMEQLHAQLSELAKGM
jgi:hypothetical protein